MPPASDEFTKRLSAALNGAKGAAPKAKPVNGRLADAATGASDTPSNLGASRGAGGVPAVQPAPGAPGAPATAKPEPADTPSDAARASAAAADGCPVGAGEHLVRDGECIS